MLTGADGCVGPEWGQPVVSTRRVFDDARCLVRLDTQKGTVLKAGAFKLDGTFSVDGFLYGLYQDAQTHEELCRSSRDLTGVSPVTRTFADLDQLELGRSSRFTLEREGIRFTTTVLSPPGNLAEPPPAIAFLYPGARASRSAENIAGDHPATIPYVVFWQRGYTLVYLDLPLPSPGPDVRVVKGRIWQGHSWTRPPGVG